MLPLIERPARHGPGRGHRRRGAVGQRVTSAPPGPAAACAGELVAADEVALDQHRPAQRAPPGQEVDPCHRVAVPPASFGQQREERVEIGHPIGVDPEQARLDRVQADRRLDDRAGQAHAPARGPERLGIVVGGQRSAAAVGLRQHQRLDVGAEAPGGVMVLAVDIGRDRPPDGDVTGAGRHRHEPTLGHDLRSRSSREVPARTRAVPRPWSRSRTPDTPVELTTSPPAFIAESP